MLIDTQLEDMTYSNLLIDATMLMLIPLTGFLFNRRSCKYLSEDSYTRLIQYYRILPIPLGVVMRSRWLEMIIAFLVNVPSTYGIVYFSTPRLREQVGLSEFLIMMLMGIGYSLILMGIYVFVEMMSHGRFYMWFTFGIAPLYAIVSLLFISLTGDSVLLFTINEATQHGLGSIVVWICLSLGVASIMISHRLTSRKLALRDLR